MARIPSSHGTGHYSLSDFKSIGKNVVLEAGVLIFHPETISIGNNVYIGHNTILKGYFKNEMVIGDDTWIGQNCFFHSAGGLSVGAAVGIGPCVKVITSYHAGDDIKVPILHTELLMRPVRIGGNSDIGVGAIVLPGVSIGYGSIIGAGAVVTRDVPDFVVAAGSPARILRRR
jgi:acetyltransferase-like isoleucine patch superfamily enzyme